MSYSIGEVARLSKVTVRALRYYDEIGLLSPSRRTEAGFQRYQDADLRRLFLILLYRELNWPLDDIARALQSPEIDNLHRQLGEINTRINRLRDMAGAIEKVLGPEEAGLTVEHTDRFAIFDTWPPREGAIENHDREWTRDDTAVIDLSWQDRFDEDEWQQARAEHEEWLGILVEAIDGGVTADSDRGADLAEAHRQYLIRWYYDCDPEFHAKVSEMYATDPDALAAMVPGPFQRPGIGAFLLAAARANAHRLAARGQN